MGLKIATVKFKSIPEFYEKEKKYIKTNTVRKYDATDERFEILKEASEKNGLKFDSLYVVEIINTETGESFKRFIQDVSIYEDLYIITFGGEV
ncbi:MAG: hypothetical protein ACLVH8_08655 [Fusobacterium sp.]